jgi:hypothetical protein
MDMQRRLFTLAVTSAAAACLMAVAWAAPVTTSAATVPADRAFGLAPSALVTETGHVTGTTGITNFGQTMIASAIASQFGVTLDEVLAVRNQDLGWGEVFKVFFYAKMSGKTVDEIIALREDDEGWGVIAKSLGLHPGLGKNNLGQTLKAQSATAAPTTAPSNNTPGNKKPKDKAPDTNPGNSNKDNGNPGRGNGHGH